MLNQRGKRDVLGASSAVLALHLPEDNLIAPAVLAAIPFRHGSCPLFWANIILFIGSYGRAGRAGGACGGARHSAKKSG